MEGLMYRNLKNFTKSKKVNIDMTLHVPNIMFCKGLGLKVYMDWAAVHYKKVT
ncbi:20005_t:CDS:2 [Dentiscutata erythropus]|uniref:20005_t:CDS:1 n=1 Tax=Dentiscutata erythropus TaxID=1348616 RepID=A0A9N9B8C2_9GLOM|nr:20005_t:CDS:2 [Dentiscutata erythropus]